MFPNDILSWKMNPNKWIDFWKCGWCWIKQKISRILCWSSGIHAPLGQRTTPYHPVLGPIGSGAWIPAEVDASNSTLSTLVCFNMAYAANRKKSGPINHFKSADLKNSCNFWVEMELESGGMAGQGFTDIISSVLLKMLRLRTVRGSL